LRPDGFCSILGFIKGKIAEEISVVSKGTSGSAFFHRTKGDKEGLVFDCKGLGLLVLFIGSGVVSGCWHGMARV
jgi:hypothetical protein